MTTTITGTRTATTEGGAHKNVTSDGVTISDFDAKNVGVGLVSIKKRPGVVRHLTIANGKIHNVGRVVAMPYDDAELDGFVLRDLLINEADMVLRLKKARNGLIENVHATGSRVPQEGFPSGCMTSDLPTENIVYRRVTMNGFRQVRVEGKYWNGDGFADEENSTGMVYEDCVACDNADGGIDTKSKGVEIVRFRAERNGRNVRLWGSGQVTDLVSVDPREAHIWLGGETRLGNYTINSPVFKGGSTKPHLQIDAGSAGVVITVIDPVVPAGEKLRIVQNDTGKLVKVVVKTSGTTPPTPPPTPPVPPTPTPTSPRTIAVTQVIDGVTYVGVLTEKR